MLAELSTKTGQQTSTELLTCGSPGCLARALEHWLQNRRMLKIVVTAADVRQLAP